MLARLKEPLDGYHQLRADKHGWLYLIENLTRRPLTGTNIYEARSIATGVVCTFRPECMELIDDVHEKTELQARVRDVPRHGAAEEEPCTA